MVGSQLSIIIDDTRTDFFTLGPTSWNISSLNEWFNGTSQSSVFALHGTTSGTIQMKFNGISAAFYGVTPPSKLSQSLLVTIDGNPSFQSSYSDPHPPSYRQWYQTPLLQDGPHSVTLSNLAGTSLDFAVVTVGSNTKLTGENVIVDNDDSGIVFNGNWRRNEDLFTSGSRPNGLPFHNSTHQTNSIGSNFAYRFTGKSVAIYGLFSFANLGTLSVNFTLDGASLTKDFRVNSDTPQFVSAYGEQENFLFNSYDFLQAGDHTLIVNVTDCINQTFSFDYLTYTPSFSSLAALPILALPPSESATSAAGHASKTKTGVIVSSVALTVLTVGALVGLLVSYLKYRNQQRNARVEPFLDRRPLNPAQSSIMYLTQYITPPSNHYRDSGLLSASSDTMHYDGADDQPPAYDESTQLRPISYLSN